MLHTRKTAPSDAWADTCERLSCEHGHFLDSSTVVSYHNNEVRESYELVEGSKLVDEKKERGNLVACI